MRNLKTLALIKRWLPFFVIAGILFFPYSVLACSGPTTAVGWTPPSIQDRVSEADIVLEGTVILVTQSSDSDIATLNVNKYYKGQGPLTVKIRGFGPETDCRTPIEVGDQAIFFTYGDPNTDLRVGKWYQADPDKIASSSRIGYNAVEYISLSTMSEIIKATGHDPVLPDGVTLAPTLTPLIQTTPAFTPTFPIETTPRAITSTSGTPVTQSVLIQHTSNSAESGLNGWLVAGLVVLGSVVISTGIFLWRKQKQR